MISIVIPLFNYKKFISETLQSIQKQSISCWEIIIVDDASTDNPLEKIDSILCDRIKYIKLDKNRGYSNAKNIGIKASHGDFIVVLDADDMLTKNSLEVRLNYLNKNTDIYWVHGWAYEFAGEKPPYNFVFKERKSVRNLKKILKTKQYDEVWNNMHAQTVMVRRSAYEKVGLYEPDMVTMGDKEMWARLLFNLGPPGFVNKFMAYYRQHNNQMHRAKWKLDRIKFFKRKLKSLIKQRKSGNLDGVVKL